MFDWSIDSLMRIGWLIECLALNVTNLEIWEFLMLACFLEIDWGILFLMMWSHILCYSFWILVCFKVWIVSLLLRKMEVCSETRPCLMWAHPCLVKNSCFKPVLFSWQCELTFSLKMTKKMIELGFLLFIKVVCLDVS